MNINNASSNNGAGVEIVATNLASTSTSPFSDAADVGVGNGNQGDDTFDAEAPSASGGDDGCYTSNPNPTNQPFTCVSRSSCKSIIGGATVGLFLFALAAGSMGAVQNNRTVSNAAAAKAPKVKAPKAPKAPKGGGGGDPACVFDPNDPSAYSWSQCYEDVPGVDFPIDGFCRDSNGESYPSVNFNLEKGCPRQYPAGKCADICHYCVVQDQARPEGTLYRGFHYTNATEICSCLYDSDPTYTFSENCLASYSYIDFIDQVKTGNGNGEITQTDGTAYREAICEVVPDNFHDYLE